MICQVGDFCSHHSIHLPGYILTEPPAGYFLWHSLISTMSQALIFGTKYDSFEILERLPRRHEDTKDIKADY